MFFTYFLSANVSKDCNSFSLREKLLFFFKESFYGALMWLEYFELKYSFF
jgi:hypothetical protein